MMDNLFNTWIPVLVLEAEVMHHFHADNYFSKGGRAVGDVVE